MQIHIYGDGNRRRHNSLIQHPSVRGCLQFLGVEAGVEIHHVADLPARSGLGTSSAFTVGLLLGLHALRGEARDKYTLAMEAVHVEQNLLQESVGSQDQFSAAYGGFNRIDFRCDGSISVEGLEHCAARLSELEQHLELLHVLRDGRQCEQRHQKNGS